VPVSLHARQGLMEAWNFNQPEARAAFEQAATADPNASMPHWGLAYSLGPGANRRALSAQVYSEMEALPLSRLQRPIVEGLAVKLRPDACKRA